LDCTTVGADWHHWVACIEIPSNVLNAEREVVVRGHLVLETDRVSAKLVVMAHDRVASLSTAIALSHSDQSDIAGKVQVCRTLDTLDVNRVPPHTDAAPVARCGEQRIDRAVANVGAPSTRLEADICIPGRV